MRRLKVEALVLVFELYIRVIPTGVGEGVAGLGTYTTFSIGTLLVESNSNHSSNKHGDVL